MHCSEQPVSCRLDLKETKSLSILFCRHAKENFVRYLYTYVFEIKGHLLGKMILHKKIYKKANQFLGLFSRKSSVLRENQYVNLDPLGDP